MDEFGHQHNGKILEMVKNESTRLLTVWNDVKSDESATVKDGNDVVNLTPSCDFNTTSHEADQGQKIVFDKFDFMQKVHHMSEAHQNIDNHWVVHMSTENSVWKSSQHG